MDAANELITTIKREERVMSAKQVKNGQKVSDFATKKAHEAHPTVLSSSPALSSECISRLQQIISDPQRIVLNSAEIPQSYLSDALGREKGSASALVFVHSATEVREIVQLAADHKIALTPRGAGTNLVGSTVPRNGNIILDFSQMNHITAFDAQNFTVTVEPGVLLEDLATYVEERGFFYPPDPGARNSSIGGNISTNAGGMRAVKYGVTRNYVLALDIVTANGEILQVGSKNRKNATGLDLLDLFVGSEGTLGIITGATLKLVAKPEISQSILVPFATASNAWDFVPEILRSTNTPTAVEFVAQSVAELGEKFLGFPLWNPHQSEKSVAESEKSKLAQCYVLLTFDGNSAQVNAAIADAQNAGNKFGALAVQVLDSRQASRVWQLRGSLVRAVEAVSEQEPIDVVVPIAQVGRFVSEIVDLEQEIGVQMVAFGHAGDGNVHLCVVRGQRNDSEWNAARKIALDRIYEISNRLGGLISAEHGIGIHKRSYFERYTNPQLISYMRAIKHAFDPLNILNPGVSYAE